MRQVEDALLVGYLKPGDQLPKVREELESGSDDITVEIEGGDTFSVTHDFAPKEREILVEGGLLHWLQEHGEKAQ